MRGILGRLALFITLISAATCLAATNSRGTFIRGATLYVWPDPSSAKLATVERGREAVLLERSPGWVHVIVTLTDLRYSPDPAAGKERTLTGWIQEQGYIGDSTANGDQILFGEAADSEEQASRSHGRKGAAGDAQRLYYRVYELFPQSPLAPEALYRSADIQWQLDRDELQSRHKPDGAEERQPIDEELMRLVHRKFPGTRWDELAAYELLENKLCVDWTVSSKCAEREAEVYDKYAAGHPNSPKAAEAGYNAAYRWAAAIAMYSGQGQSQKSEEAHRRAENAAQKLMEKNAGPEWNAKARRLLYLVQNHLPVYGAAME